MPSKKTKYGRTIKSGHKDYSNFVYPNPFDTKKGGGFNVRALFQQGDVVPVFVQQDDLNVQETISKVADYLSPSKTNGNVTSNGSPYRQTKTPRHRVFKKVGRITAEKEGKISQVDFYQVSNVEKTFKNCIPVIHKSPKKILDHLTPPPGFSKQVKRFVTKSAIKKARDNKRLGPKRLFHNTSANEIVHSQSPGQPLKTNYHLSHLDQVGAGGKDTRETVIAATAGANYRRIAMVENPGTMTIFNNKNKMNGLNYEAEVDLQKDKNGGPTHIGGHLEVSVWKSPKKTRSVKVEHDPQNPELPTKALDEMAQCIYNKTFS